MKKDVMVAIRSTQHFEGCDPEQVDLVTCALLYERGGKYYIVYDESELTGLQGTRTTVKLDDTTVLMRRVGTHPSQMLFMENRRHVGLYDTGYGSMTVATHTSRIHNTIGENGGHLALDYTVEVDNALAGRHHFEMIVTPQS